MLKIIIKKPGSVPVELLNLCFSDSYDIEVKDDGRLDFTIKGVNRNINRDFSGSKRFENGIQKHSSGNDIHE